MMIATQANPRPHLLMPRAVHARPVERLEKKRTRRLAEVVLTPNLVSQTWFDHTYIVATPKDNLDFDSRGQDGARPEL
jgi:hypothetical protein